MTKVLAHGHQMTKECPKHQALMGTHADWRPHRGEGARIAVNSGKSRLIQVIQPNPRCSRTAMAWNPSWGVVGEAGGGVWPGGGGLRVSGSRKSAVAAAALPAHSMGSRVLLRQTARSRRIQGACARPIWANPGKSNQIQAGDGRIFKFSDWKIIKSRNGCCCGLSGLTQPADEKFSCAC
jgi:hypothetical protein